MGYIKWAWDRNRGPPIVGYLEVDSLQTPFCTTTHSNKIKLLRKLQAVFHRHFKIKMYGEKEQAG